MYTVITGASSGIGYEGALAFAEKGKNLIIIARRKDELEKLKSLIFEKFPSIDVIVKIADLASSKVVYDLYESLKEYKIETWINNAGFGDHDELGKLNLNKIEKMLDLNIKALTILSELYVKDYENVEGSMLINTSSVVGYNIIPSLVTYSATKFYVSAFTEGMAQELKLKGSKLKAKILAPASTETEFVQRAYNISAFDYKSSGTKFHTAKEMATFLIQLFDSEKVVGIVNKDTYEFELKDPMFSFLS
jgi:uncharacterized protein